MPSFSLHYYYIYNFENYCWILHILQYHITIIVYEILKSVFPTSVAKALMQLGTLQIEDWATVEEIVAKEEGIETTTLFVFPQLTTLTLRNLPKLKSFYPANHISEWPTLRSLAIKKCNKLMKIFGSNKSSMQETNGVGHFYSLIQQPLFFIEKVTTSLACLYILLI